MSDNARYHAKKHAKSEQVWLFWLTDFMATPEAISARLLRATHPFWGMLMAGHLTRLRIETLEDRHLLSANPLVDLNGAAFGVDYAVERVDGKGLVSIVSHDLLVASPSALQFSSATITIINPQAGDVLGALTHGTSITAAYAGGVLQLTGIDSVAHYQQVLRTARFNSTATRTVGDHVDISFTVNDGLASSNAAHSVLTVIPAGTASVAGLHLFYNHSKFDGDNLAAGAADDQAIATDKQALPQGQTATQANYTNYYRGINGIMVDIAGPHGAVSANDFILQVGNNNLPDTWLDAPSPLTVTTRAGAGQGGSDRVEIIWADGAIANEWLQIVVAANSHTGLTTPDTFLFGNSTGESGNSSNDANVTAIDALRVINRVLSGGTGAATIDDPLDYNRDGNITAIDALLAINRMQSSLPDLNLTNVAPIAPERLNSTSSSSTIIMSRLPDNSFIYSVGVSPVIEGHPLPYKGSVSVEPTTITLIFTSALSTAFGTAGPHSAANPSNYQLFKDGVEQLGSIVSAAVETTTSGSTPPLTQSSVTLSFDRALTPGDYRLVALGTIFDTSFRPFDRQGDNMPGSDYPVLFSVSPVIRHGDAAIVAQNTDAPADNVLTPAVVSTASGDFVVAWSKQDDWDAKFHLFIQRYTAADASLGTPLLVSTDINPRDVSLGIDAAGTLTVVWSSQPNNPAGYGKPLLEDPGHIFARRYGADLKPLGDEFQVDLPSRFDIPMYSSSALNPDLAVNAQGDVVISWEEKGLDQQVEVVAQRYDATGLARGGILPLSTDRANYLWSPPQIAMDATGNFAVLWAVSDFVSHRIVARLFNASGLPQGAEFNIQESTSGIVSMPAIAMSAAGDFIVAWQNTTGWNSEVLARRFNSAGQPVGEPFRVDPENASGTAGSPQLSLDSKGQFLVVWQVTSDASPAGHYTPAVAGESLFFARTYDHSGNALMPSSLVTSDQFVDPSNFDGYVGPYAASAAIAINAHDQAMMVWTQGASDSYLQYGEQDTLLAQTWILDHPPELDLNGPAAGLDFAIGYQSGQSAVPIVDAAQLLVSDQPAGRLISARITIDNPQQGDWLAVNTHGTAISTNYSYGVLSLTGADTAAHYQAVLRTTTFGSTSHRATGSKIHFSFVVNDGTSDSPTVHSLITTG